MTLQQLYYYQCIAKNLHYRIAAEELHVAQPTLSRSMANLEHELGVYLFERSGRNVVLTRCGELFLAETNRILKDVESAQEHMRHLASDQSGHIDIGYVSPLAKSYIPKTVRGFLKQRGNHNISFSLKQDFTNNLVNALSNNQLDAIFSSFLPDHPELEFVPVLTQNFVAIVPQNHKLATHDRISLSAFTEYPFITYNTYSALGSYIKKLFSKHGLTPTVFCEASDEYAIAALVEEEFGISLVADCHAIQQANVKILPIEENTFTHTVYMIYPKNKYQTPAVQKFIHFVQETTPNL